jgi:hypothetical protein
MPDDDPTPDPAPDPTPDPTPDPAPETGATQAEVDKAYAKLREAETARKALEQQLAERARKDAEEQGRFQELAQTERERAERLEAEKATETSRRHAEQTASSLKFKDAGYALYLLNGQNVDLTDAAAVRSALDGIAQARPDLVAGHVPPPSGGPAGGSKGEPPSMTAEQVASMTPRQLAAIDPDVIKTALGQQ